MIDDRSTCEAVSYKLEDPSLVMNSRARLGRSRHTHQLVDIKPQLPGGGGKTETVKLTLVVIAASSRVSQCVCASGRVRECSPPEITRKKPRQSSAHTTTVIDMQIAACIQRF